MTAAFITLTGIFIQKAFSLYWGNVKLKESNWGGVLVLKRKFGDRSDWERVLIREYAQAYIESDSFNGYVTLLRIVKVSDPLYVNYNGEKIQ